MKLVRRYINEKFVEDSDPVHDMGIGIQSMIDEIKKTMKETWGWSDDLNDSDIVHYCISPNKDALDVDVDKAILIINYLFNHGVSTQEDNGQYGYRFIERCISYFFNNGLERSKKMLKFLIEKKCIIKPNDLSEALKLQADINEEIIMILLNACPKNYLTPSLLNIAALYNKKKTLKFLIKKGVEPTTKNHYALQQAIKHRNNEAIKLLIPYLKKDYKI